MKVKKEDFERFFEIFSSDKYSKERQKLAYALWVCFGGREEKEEKSEKV